MVSRLLLFVVEPNEWLTRHRYDPVQKFAPQDCVASVNAIVEKIDYLISLNNSAAIQQLKGIFGLAELSDIRDFAMTIAFPSTSPPLPLSNF